MSELISCLCPTKNKPEVVRKAIECFRDQVYKNKELVLVTDTENPYLEDLKVLVEEFSDNGDITLVEAPANSTLGALRNISVDSAKGEYVATWDDDDIHHIKRIALQYKRLKDSKREACYLTGTIIKDNTTGDVALSNVGYSNPCTMLALKSSLPRYNEVPITKSGAGGDDMPVYSYHMNSGRMAWLEMPHLYIYNIHGGNTCSYEIQRRWMDKVI